MDKPITLQVQEFKENIVKLVNDSKLPAFILKPVVLDLVNELVKLEQIQYETDLKEYQNLKEVKDVQN